ncbi:hypothetical protein E1180_01995 [Roseibium denhamense]|uniref:Uncharacterized protein n=1 Tax=Roseibium denhamense TaxID=76305 RepID=A0ABY1NEL7_9HYPH|nr:hypothetical protein [Roseibium denhamense]MTI04288.1 hypothetical protein [Roseibium denhamense]SMP07786.1 hypothetical protein SAMN06265374_0888 [Roseibium denhamense]
MPLTRQEFRRQVWDVVRIYREDNAWVGRWRNSSWNNDHIMEIYIRAAYRLYDATANNHHKLVLLGDTAIRSAEDLILNFGLTAANGIQEDEVVQTADNADAQRQNAWGANAIPVRGAGSILSENGWTPILNDALIVGSATAGHGFYLTLNRYESGLWREAAAMARGKLPALRRLYVHKYGPGIDGNGPTDEFMMSTPEFRQQVWKYFMNWNIGMFWDVQRQNPRVLAREILGLSFLGYETVFNDQELFFRKRWDTPDPNFATYANRLRALRFHDSGARARILQSLSMYLFQDNTAIGFRADLPAIRAMPIIGHQQMQLV